MCFACRARPALQGRLDEILVHQLDYRTALQFRGNPAALDEHLRRRRRKGATA